MQKEEQIPDIVGIGESMRGTWYEHSYLQQFLFYLRESGIKNPKPLQRP
ncbi:hypothetical protein [Anaerocolumna jejuensis]|nr:hypothetical protein [Anaerocolumna jejuensis]